MLRFWKAVRRSHPEAAQDEPPKIPCYQTAAYPSGVACLLLLSIPALRGRGLVSDVTQEAPEVANHRSSRCSFSLTGESTVCFSPPHPELATFSCCCLLHSWVAVHSCCLWNCLLCSPPGLGGKKQDEHEGFWSQVLGSSSSSTTHWLCDPG